MKFSILRRFTKRGGDTTVEGASNQQRSRNATLPHLPDDVLLYIMLAATDLYPDPYSSHCHAPIATGASTPFLLSSNSVLDLVLHARSLWTKVAFSRVSKRWRELSASILFNTIILNDSRQIPRLSYAFDGDRSRRGGVEGPGSWAWHVRRLWVVQNEGFSFWVRLEDGLPPFTLHDLLERCPNITAFRNLGAFTNQVRAWPQTDESRRSVLSLILRGVSLEDDNHRSEVPDDKRREVDLDMRGVPMCFMIPGLPDARYIFGSIQVLKLQCHSKSVDFDDVLFTNAEFPALEYLHLNGVRACRQATLFRMPALKRLSFDPRCYNHSGIQTAETGFQTMIRFLECHGESLDELSLTSFTRLSFDLNTLCSNLTTINVVAIDQTMSQLLPMPHAKVGHLGLTTFEIGVDPSWSHFFPYGDSSSYWHSSEYYFAPLFESYPNLRTIQYFSWDEATLMAGSNDCWSRPSPRKQMSDFLPLDLGVMLEHKVQLIDWLGRPILKS